jgi:aminopeptidase
MTDHRIRRLAEVLINYSANIGPGDRVLIEAEPMAEPLIRAVFEEILESGGHPHLLISLSGQVSLTGLDDIFMRKANSDQLNYVPPFYQAAYEQFESRIRIQSESNTRNLSNIEPTRMAQRRRAVKGIIEAQMRRGWKENFRWVSTLYPTLAYAQDAEMSLEEYEAFVYGACHVEGRESDPVAYWKTVESDQERLVQALAGHDEVLLRGPHCELSLSIKGRAFINACGQRNMPDGEIFTGPVEKSVNGWIRFTYPAVYRGTEVDGIMLRFREGRVVEATAEKNQLFLEKMLDTDPASCYLGEFAFGTNFGIQKFTKNILFDEKIGGSIHIALGAGYPETGSENKSAIHWDMICDMRDESEVLLDGELFYKNGAFQV